MQKIFGISEGRGRGLKKEVQMLFRKMYLSKVLFKWLHGCQLELSPNPQDDVYDHIEKICDVQILDFLAAFIFCCLVLLQLCWGEKYSEERI